MFDNISSGINTAGLEEDGRSTMCEGRSVQALYTGVLRAGKGV